MLSRNYNSEVAAHCIITQINRDNSALLVKNPGRPLDLGSMILHEHENHDRHLIHESSTYSCRIMLPRSKVRPHPRRASGRGSNIGSKSVGPSRI
jgi:hypothetical protein